jgi:hypothetical protein
MTGRFTDFGGPGTVSRPHKRPRFAGLFPSPHQCVNAGPRVWVESPLTGEAVDAYCPFVESGSAAASGEHLLGDAKVGIGEARKISRDGGRRGRPVAVHDALVMRVVASIPNPAG